MTAFRRSFRFAPRAAILTLALLPGCGEPSTVPPDEEARAALVAALEAWKSGTPSGDLPGTSPAVQAVDDAWRSGKKLTTYEILREEPSEHERRIVVRRQLEGAKEPEEVLYVIFGREPIRVYAEEDYRRLLDMDNNPTPTKRPRRR